MAPDGRLYEIDGNKDFSVSVFAAELSPLGYRRTSGSLGPPFAMAEDGMHAGAMAMEEFAARVLSNALAGGGR